MADVPRYVIDASVVVKWHLSDEEHAAEALTILSDFQEGRIELLAPQLLRYEVASAIFKQMRRGRLSIEWAVDSIKSMDTWGISLLEADPLEYAADRAHWLGSSFHDGIYVATAISAGIPLISADGALRRASANRYVFFTWIEDYRSPSDVISES